MGRELRRVPADWQHPKDDRGDWLPMHEWFGCDEETIAQGLEEGWLDASLPHYGCPLMPQWPFSERTHVQYYESTTEGTPLSPVLPTVEELAAWCLEDAKRPGSYLLRGLSLEDWTTYLRGEFQLWYRRARDYVPFQHLSTPPGLGAR